MLRATHPEFEIHRIDWMALRDVYRGERIIKEKSIIYLPPTRSMLMDGMLPKQVGFEVYESYKLRAVWHDLFKEAVEVYMGLLHQKPADYQLPPKMQFLLDHATEHGEGLEQLHRRVNEEQLVSGRVGLLVDLPINPNPSAPEPYIALYKGDHIRNWGAGNIESIKTPLQFVVLDESGYVTASLDTFTWTSSIRYRLLALNPDGNYVNGLFEGVEDPSFDINTMNVPVFRGEPLKIVPFTFVNSKDTMPRPDEPPLLGLCRAVLAMYRSEADYRQNLFMQGQDTLVTIGALMKKDPTNPDEPLRVGAGARIDIESGGDAKYIGVDSKGLPEQRQALENDRGRAEVLAGQLINARQGDKESGSALQTRLAAQTATLTQISRTGAAGLELSLKNMAMWMGEDPSLVKVTPNMEFSNISITGQDLAQIMMAKTAGVPWSLQSIHQYLVNRGFTTRTWEEEQAELKIEPALPTPPSPPAPIVPPTNRPPVPGGGGR